MEWSGFARAFFVGAPLHALGRVAMMHASSLKPSSSTCHHRLSSAYLPFTRSIPPTYLYQRFLFRIKSYLVNTNYDTFITMSCKRKRSVDESPVSACSFGSFATPETQSPTPIASGYAMDMEAPMSRGVGWDFSNLGRVKSGDWIQRTRKRVRDNRPDEHVIHGMYHRHLLYVPYSNAAQKQP